MARPIDHDRKSALRAAAGDYLLTHGIAEFSLRPLAETLGTSARMLIHHFGSRDALLREALEAVREHERADFESWRRRKGNATAALDQQLLWHWRRLTTRRMRPRVRQLFELYVAALGDPEQSRWLFQAPHAYWIEALAAAGCPPDERAVKATIILAALRGFLLDLVAGGDTARLQAAVKAFARSLVEPQ
jgi:AcrR family transcriptional regulator